LLFTLYNLRSSIHILIQKANNEMIVSDPMSLIITEMNMFDKTNLKLLKLKEKLISC